MVSNIAFFAFRNVIAMSRFGERKKAGENSPLEQYRYGGIDRRTTGIAAHDLLHRDDCAPSVIGRDGVDDPKFDPRVGLPSGLFGRPRFLDGRFICRGEEHDVFGVPLTVESKKYFRPGRFNILSDY
jgi:hypothetical protein